MRKTLHVLTKTFLIAVLLNTGIFAQASAKDPAVILIVDFAALLSESKVAKNVNEQVRKMVEKLQKEDTEAIEAFQKEVEKLKSQRSVISEDVLKEKAVDIGKRQEKHQTRMQKEAQALQLGRAKARSEIEKVLRPVFAEIMKRHDGTIMLDQTQVLAGGIDLNVTAEIMSMLNERLSSLEVKPVDPETVKKN